MTIKRRIFISNTAIVLISLLLLFGIFGGIFGIFGNEYTRGVESQTGLSDNTYEIQTMLLEEQSGNETWDTIALKAEEYGFTIHVADENDNEQFSNISRSEMECVDHLKAAELAQGEVKLYYIGGATAAKAVFVRESQSFKVYAIHSELHQFMWGMNGGMFETFIIVFVITGLLAIAGLLLLSQIFTRMLVKKIMKPVEVLEKAAKRINDGELDTPILYEKQDEFQPVCNTFNHMQAHLKEGMEKNAAYEKARTEMVSGISHDLRTPLTAVKGFLKGILDGVANTPEKQRQYVKVSYQKACEMDILLQKLFFFSKLETGNMPFVIQRVDLGCWMESYVSDKEEEGLAKGYSIGLINDTQECSVKIDVEQMKRVFDNLIENSIKYAETPELHISLQIRKAASKVRIIVSDNGKGLDAEKLSHVFEQFYRGDESRDTKKEGSGLGLYVCQYIVKEHDGVIKAYSKDGFQVEIELPAAK